MNESVKDLQNKGKAPNADNVRADLVLALKKASFNEMGEYFQRLRELAHRSEAEMATEMGISIYQLRAFEANDEKELPAQIYVKSYIARYCQALGIASIDAKEIVARLGKEEAPALNRVSISNKSVTRPSFSKWLSYVGLAILLLLVVFWLNTIDFSGLLDRTMSTPQEDATSKELTLPPVNNEETPAVTELENTQ